MMVPNPYQYASNPLLAVMESGVEKIVHYLGGIFIWEFFSTIWFEWSFITGKRPYRWSIWIYSAIRLVTLVNVFVDIIRAQILIDPLDCQAWLNFELATVYLSFVLGELLMILKISAVWCRNKWVLAVSVCAWLTNIAFVIRCIVTSSTDREHYIVVCVILSGETARDTTLVTLSTETFLLLVLLMGLLRERDHYLGRFLFNRGLVWLLVAIFAQVPLILLLSFNLQELGFMVLHSVSLLSMAICVTRIYRGLGTVNDCRCIKGSLNIGTTYSTGASPMRFASRHPDSSPSTIQTQATEPIAISVSEAAQDDANEGNSLEPKFPTTTAPRGHDAA